MATVSIAKIKIRRGTDSERREVILDTGEIGYVTDAAARRLFVGDGSTKGGNPAGIKFYTGAIDDPDPALTTAQVGDIIYNSTDNKLYCLTGYNIDNFPAYNDINAYQFVGSRVDDSTIEYNANGVVRIKQSGVQSTHLNSNILAANGGLSRASSTSPISVNVDNNTLQINSNQISVNVPAVAVQINLSDINALGQNINGSSLFFSGIPTEPSLPGQLWCDVNSGNVLRIS